MIRRLYLIISIWAFLSVPLFGSVTDDAAKRVMDAYAARLLAGDFQVGELFGELYIKEYVDVKKQSLVLNIIPDLARFDSEKQKYLSEFFYEIHYVDNAVPDIRCRAHLTSYKRGNGEIDRVLYYMYSLFTTRRTNTTRSGTSERDSSQKRDNKNYRRG